MEDKDLPGIGKQIFPIVLNEEWVGNIPTYKYIVGYDDYRPIGQPINFYNKIKKFLGLKFKEKESFGSMVIYKRYKNGVIEFVK